LHDEALYIMHRYSQRYRAFPRKGEAAVDPALTAVCMIAISRCTDHDIVVKFYDFFGLVSALTVTCNVNSSCPNLPEKVASFALLPEALDIGSKEVEPAVGDRSCRSSVSRRGRSGRGRVVDLVDDT